MKKQQWLLGVGLLLFIALILGATLLYNGLSEGQRPDNLVAVSTTTAASLDPSASSTTSDPSASSTTSDPSASSAPTATAGTEAPAANPAPDFTVTDRDGNPVKLSELRGKPVVLNFWASWCGPCKSEMPAFEQAYRTYGESIRFMLVNATDGSRETVETARTYVDGQGYTFPIYFDTTMEASIAYGASSIPLTIFIDAEGNLVAYGAGALDAATLQRGIDMILPQ